jgi:hypothetical protein
MDLVRPKEPLAVEWDGIPQVFNPDRLFEPHHPLVRKYPDRFTEAVPLPQDMVPAGPGLTRTRKA